MTHAKAARRDLVEIWLYSAREWGVARADAYLNEIHEVVERLAASPELGSLQIYRRKRYRRMRSGSHIIIYRSTNAAIAILRVLHQRMDIARHL